MKNKSIIINAFLNVIKTVNSIIFPLITFPYISRILHVDNLGIFNFCSSVISYFALLAGLGINTYAIREGSRYRNNRTKMDKFCSEVFTINFISTLLAYIFLIISILVFSKLKMYYLIILVLSVSIFFTTMGCEWIFNIYEDFAYITFRSCIFQIISLILLFLFVKDSNDLLLYSIITVIASSGANILNIISRRKYCTIRFVFSIDIVKHISAILLLFAYSITTTIYINSDVTLLGIFSGSYYTGLYSVSSKVYTMVKTLLGALIVVSIPRLSAFLGEKKYNDYLKSSNRILNTLLFVSVPAMVGIFCLSDNIILILSGDEYIKASLSLKILSFSLLFSIISWFFISCVLIPFREDKKVLISTSVSAIINIILNLILIPLYNQNAAAFTTLFAELSSALLCFYFSKDIFKLRVFKKDLLSMLIGCIIIFSSCYIINNCISSALISCFISIIISVILYFLITLIFKNNSLMYFYEIFYNKFFRKKVDKI